MKRLISILALTAAACTPNEPQGYVTLALPTQAQMSRLAAAELPAEAPKVTSWTITVSAEDMPEPVIVTTAESEISIPVKAGPGRIVHVAGRAEAVAGVTQGYDGETVVDVAEEGDTAAEVNVYRSVTVKDANAPVNRTGAAAGADAPDADEISITLGPDSLQLFVTFANDVAAPWNSSVAGSLRGLIEFDTDRNPATGKVSLVQLRHRTLTGAAEANLLGVELAIDLTPVEEGYVKLLTGDTAKAVEAKFGARTLSFNIPWDYLGGRFVDLRFAALLSNKSGSLDFVPETGFVEVVRANAPVPTAALQAVKGFDGAFITTVYSSRYVQPAITATPAGIKAAWYDDAYYYVASSQLGTVFSAALKGAAPQGETPGAVDIAADAAGNTFLAVTLSNPQYIGYVSVMGVGSGFVGLKSTAPLGWYPQSDRPAQIAARDGVAYVTQPYNFDMNNVYVYKDGVLSAGANAGALTDLAIAVSGDKLLVASYAVTYAASNYVQAALQTVAAGDSLTSIPSPVNVGSPMVSFMTYGNIDVASNGTSTYYLLTSVNAQYEAELNVVDGSGNAIAFPAGAAVDTLAAGPMGYGEGLSLPQIAVSKSGRVSVVWHASGNGGVPAAPSLAGSFITEGLSGIYYAELLPGATAFSQPIRIANGNTAAIAFDANERPVVLVTTASADRMGYPVQSYLHAYRGQ